MKIVEERENINNKINEQNNNVKKEIKVEMDNMINNSSDVQEQE